MWGKLALRHSEKKASTPSCFYRSLPKKRSGGGNLVDTYCSDLGNQIKGQ
jgi:hypothetical protein